MAETATDQNVGEDVKSEQASEQSKTGGDMIPKARFNEVVQQRKEALEQLDVIANELADDIPDDMRDLIPNLPAKERIGWIRNALKVGLFSKEKASSSPDSKRAGGKKAPDYEGMSPQAIMATGYKS